MRALLLLAALMPAALGAACLGEGAAPEAPPPPPSPPASPTQSPPASPTQSPPPSPVAENLAPPAVAARAEAVAFALPVRMIGTEPFWGGTISEDAITLSGADRPDLRMAAGQRTVTEAGVSWRTRRAPGSPTEVVVTLTPEPCSDGMSDRRYPFAATVSVGPETLRGCALAEAEFVRGR